MGGPGVTRVIRAVYRGAKRLPLGGALESRPARTLRHRLAQARPHLVLDTLDALHGAGVKAWLVGGWGVDALAGRQTRMHRDLDIAFDLEGDAEARAVSALRRLGFEPDDGAGPAGCWMPRRVLLRDGAGHVVDLLPATYEPFGPFGQADPSERAFRYGDETFTVGSVAGRAVPCLSAVWQLRFHSRYDPNDGYEDSHRHDVGVLKAQLPVTTRALMRA